MITTINPKPIVVDANIVASVVLPVEMSKQKVEACRSALRVSTVWAPTLLYSEMANIILRYTRLGLADVVLCKRALTEVFNHIEWVEDGRLWEDAVDLGVAHTHKAYDMIYIALATRMNAPLLTYDKSLLKKFPRIACSP